MTNWQNELPLLIPVDIMIGVSGLTTMPWQQSPSQMGPQDRLPVVTQA